MPLPELRRLAYLRTDRLGETLLNVAAVHALKRARPDVHVTFVADALLEPLLSRQPIIDDVLPWSFQPGERLLQRSRRLADALKAERFDAAVVSNPRKDLHLAVRLAGIPVRAGYSRKWGRWLLNRRRPDPEDRTTRHEVEWSLDLLRLFADGLEPPPGRYLEVPSAAPSVTARLLDAGIASDAPLIAVHPWSSNPDKAWPLARYRELIEQVSRAGTVAVVGAWEHEDACEALLQSLPPVLNLVGRTDLIELSAWLQRARVLVTNDSGPMHLAAAVGTPVVALFGTGSAGSHPRRWGPWGAGHTTLHRPLETLGVADVAEAALRYLAAAV